MFPPNHKVDVSMRRMRITDFSNIIRSHKYLSYCSEMKMDYIWTMNFVLWCLCYPEFFDKIKYFNCFLDRDSFFEWGTKQSRLTKVSSATRLERSAFSEITALLGYKVFDPQFDIDKEAEKLANSGIEKTNWWNEVFFSFRAEGQHIDVNGFPDYVKKVDWITAGSASKKTKIKFTDGEEKNTMCKKNFLPFLFSSEELVSDAQSTNLQINKALIKDELAKRRLAVASDNNTYLKQSYGLSKFSFSLPGCSLLYDNSQMIDMFNEIKEKISGNYGEPLDFEAFDHQPTLAELKYIHSFYVTDDLNFITNSFFSDLDRATLSTKDKTYDIKGGLQSGQRTTSYDGNYFSYLVKRTTQNIIKQLFPYIFDPVYTLFRGDDSSDIYYSKQQALLYALIPSAARIKFAMHKFGIFFENTEFLRTWINTNETVGYSSRAIPSMTQRKPWNSEPWTEFSDFLSIVESNSTIFRRSGRNIFSIEEITSFFPNLTLNIVYTPKHLGGIGLCYNDNLQELVSYKIRTTGPRAIPIYNYYFDEMKKNNSTFDADKAANSFFSELFDRDRSSSKTKKIISFIKNSIPNLIKRLSRPGLTYSFPQVPTQFASLSKLESLYQNIILENKFSTVPSEYPKILINNAILLKKQTNFTKQEAIDWLLGSTTFFPLITDIQSIWREKFNHDVSEVITSMFPLPKSRIRRVFLIYKTAFYFYHNNFKLRKEVIFSSGW